MVNGDGQHKEDLLHGENPHGVGDLSVARTIGFDKMPEEALDRTGFTEVMAVVRGQNDGNWLAARKRSGAAFLSSEVFGQGTLEIVMDLRCVRPRRCRRMDLWASIVWDSVSCP